jgi:hypothetical protein
MRGIKLSFAKPVRPKKPFMRDHIVDFMTFAKAGSLLNWRAALPLALCYQQLLGGAEAFYLNGSNIKRRTGHFHVEVDSSKNVPDGFSFWAGSR